MSSVLCPRSCPRYINLAACGVSSFSILINTSNIPGFSTFKTEYKGLHVSVFSGLFKNANTKMDVLSSVLGSRSCPRYIDLAACRVSSFSILTNTLNISGSLLSKSRRSEMYVSVFSGLFNLPLHAAMFCCLCWSQIDVRTANVLGSLSAPSQISQICLDSLLSKTRKRNCHVSVFSGLFKATCPGYMFSVFGVGPKPSELRNMFWASFCTLTNISNTSGFSFL